MSPERKDKEAGMRLTMKEKKSVIAVVSQRYKGASKKEKGAILPEITEITGYNRSYASHVLSIHGRGKRIGKNRYIQADIKKKAKRQRLRIYEALVKNFVSGHRIFC